VDCVVGQVLKPKKWQAVGGELDLVVLIGGAEKWITIQWRGARGNYFFEHLLSSLYVKKIPMVLFHWIAAHSTIPPLSVVKSNPHTYGLCPI
jgi:hypothetical protein